MSDVGHNSSAEARIKSFVERAERINDEIDASRLDLAKIFKEAKGEGFDAKTLKKIVALRKKDHDKLREEHTILALYAAACGLEDIFG